MHVMMHNRRWFIPQLLPRGEQSVAQLGVLASNLAPRSRAQVRPKAAILCEQSLLESHVRAKRGLFQPSSFKTEVEGSERCEGVAPFWEPPRSRIAPLRKDATPAAGPLALEQTGRQLLQPHWLNYYVVVHECKHVALSFRNPTVKSVRFPWPRFEQITKAARVSATEVRNDITRLIVRIVVNH